MSNTALSIIISLFCIVGIAIVLLAVRDKEKSARIEQILHRKQQVIDKDSLAAIIERRVIDSLDKRIIEPLRSRLKSDSVELHLMRKKNEKLENLFRSIDVSDRPRY